MGISAPDHIEITPEEAKALVSESREAIEILFRQGKMSEDELREDVDIYKGWFNNFDENSLVESFEGAGNTKYYDCSEDIVGEIIDKEGGLSEVPELENPINVQEDGIHEFYTVLSHPYRQAIIAWMDYYREEGLEYPDMKRLNFLKSRSLKSGITPEKALQRNRSRELRGKHWFKKLDRSKVIEIDDEEVIKPDNDFDVVAQWGSPEIINL